MTGTSIPLYKSLAGRLLVALTTVALLSLLELGLFAYFSERAALEAQVTAQLTSVASLKKEQIINWLEERQADARQLAENRLNQEHLTEILAPDTPPDRKAEFAAFLADNLRSMQKARTGYSQIVMVDTKGTVIIATDPALEGQSVLHAEAFRRTLDSPNGHYIHDIHRDPGSGEIRMDFGHVIRAVDPVSHRELTYPAGVLLLSVRMDETIYPLIRAWPGMGQSGETLLVRAEGDETLFLNNLRFDENAALNLRIPLSSANAHPAHRAARGMEGVVQKPDYRGVPVLAAYRHIPGIGWGFVAKQDLTEAFAPVRQLTRRFVLLGITIVAAALLISATLSRTLTRPLVQLVQGTRDVAGGNLNTAINIFRDDEIGELAAAFRQMLQSLQLRQRQIEAANQAIHRRSEQLAALHHLSLTVNSTLDASSVLQLAVEQTAQVLDAARSGIFLLDDAGNLQAGAISNAEEEPSIAERLTIAARLWEVFPPGGQEAQTMSLAEAQKYLPELEQLRLYEIRSIILLRLEHGGQMLGMQVVLFRQPAVPAEDVQIAQTIAQIVSPAIAHARSYNLTLEQLQQTNRRLSLVNHIARQLSVMLDPDALLSEVVRIIQSKLGYRYVGVGLAEGDEVVFQVVLPTEKDAPAAVRLPLDRRSIAGQVVSAGKALRVDDVTQGEFCCRHPMLAESRSQMGAPLQLGGHTLGVLLVGSRQIAAFDEDDEALLQAIADQLALALENARTFRRLSHQAQVLAQTNEELVRIAQAKTDFINTVNHELRTPLTAVIGFAELLSTQRGGPLTPKQQHFARQILKSGQHMLSLVNDLLDLAKLEARKMTLQPEKVQVSNLFAEVTGMLAARAAGKQIALETHLPDTTLWLEADPTRLRQVFLNLLSNALKFTPPNGVVRLHARRQTHNGQEEILFRVTDTGVGIKPEDAEKVFGAFDQIANPLSRTEAGTGLGMVVTRQLVELHHGRIWFESIYGQGTTFFVALPVRQPPPETS
ncbi:MAG: GAF domain-containing protein [Caldilineae bacterium]|nr:MAG: GAF domain-containing protein [Caldilineae bacterium]